MSSAVRLNPGDTVLFIGDSVTDCGRREPADGPLGNGYVRMIANELAGHDGGSIVTDTGISGNRAVDLQDRWQFDCLDHRPNVLSIMVGINDTWRRYDQDSPTTTEAVVAAEIRTQLCKGKTVQAEGLRAQTMGMMSIALSAFGEDGEVALAMRRYLATNSEDC